MKQVILVLMIGLLLLSVVAAEPYSGDVSFTIAESGKTTISGTSSYPLFALSPTNNLVSQKDGYYLFNLTVSDEQFSDLSYELHLPANAVINYIKTPEFNRIEHNANSLTIVGSAENKYVTILVQYSFPKEKSSNWSWILTVLGVLGLGVYFYVKTRKISSSKKTITVALTSRQEQIVKLLQKGPLTQAALEKQTGLPKSSLSRNIAALVRKGVVEKQEQGMTNKIKLK